MRAYRYAPKTGCIECKKRTASETHKGKVLSEETKRKIGTKAIDRPGSLTGKVGSQHPRYKGSAGRDPKKPSNEDLQWKNAVCKRCNRTCVVTKERDFQRKGQPYVCHHLNAFNLYEDLRYVAENGVYVKREIHLEFHKYYGFGNNTEEQFAEFCRRFYNIDWFKQKKELNL